MKTSEILLVENDPDHAELIMGLIEKECNKRVVLKRDGREAMDYFWRNGTFGQNLPTGADETERCCELDLIILDLNLPKVHGMDILRFLKRNLRYRPIPVVILSTSSDDKTIEEAYENGAAEYVTKSTSFQVFIEKIKLMSYYVPCIDTTASVENFYGEPDSATAYAKELIEGINQRRNFKRGIHNKR